MEPYDCHETNTPSISPYSESQSHGWGIPSWLGIKTNMCPLSHSLRGNVELLKLSGRAERWIGILTFKGSFQDINDIVTFLFLYISGLFRKLVMGMAKSDIQLDHMILSSGAFN